MSNRLANRHPVERILVMIGQSPQFEYGSFTQIKRQDIVLVPFGRDV